MPAVAAADTHTVTFDDLATGTDVSTQYLNAGGSQQGVEFGKDDSGSSAGVDPVVTTDSSNVNHVGDICLCNGEFHTIDVWGRFPFLKHSLSIDVGAFGGGGPVPMSLTGYDATGTEVDSQSTTVTPGAPATTLALSSPSGQLAFFELDRTDNGSSPVVYIDNLSYDVPAVPPPPQYAIHWTGPVWAGSDFATSTGTSINTTVAVTRVNGSTGPLSFFASNLPTGVTASFPLGTVTSASSIPVTFTVAANAPAATDHPITITAAAANPTASGASPQTTTIPLTVLARYDEQIRGIEVVQSVQSLMFPSLATNDVQKAGLPQLPERNFAVPSAPVNYQGVMLARDGTTVARVWASIDTPTALPLPPVPVALHGFDSSGHELPGSPLIGNEMTLPADGRPFVSWNDMVNPGNSWDFTLPASWTEHGLLKLKATLLPSDYFETVTQSECNIPICAADNSFTLSNIPFTDTNPVTLTLLAMTVGNETLPTPGAVFKEAESLIPTFDGGLEFAHNSYAGSVDITDLNTTENKCIADAKKNDTNPDDLKDDLTDCSDDANDDVLDREEDWADEHGHGRVTIGVNNGTARGVTVGSLGNIFKPHPDAVVDLRRPLTSVAHELFHALGRSHASDCNDGGGDDWPPDQEGWIHGIGFDRNGNGGLGLFGTIAPPVPVPSGVDPSKLSGTPGAAFDFMSYCAAIRPDFNSWISDRGWNETLQYLHDHHGTDARDTASAAAATPTLHVVGFANHDGIHVTTVTPELDGPAAHPMTGPTTSTFNLQVMGASGQSLASVPMQAIGGHNDHGGPVVLLDASVPLPGATGAAGDAHAAAGAVPASVSIASPGFTTATLSRSPHVPVVKVLAPRAGSTVGRGKSVAVRYRAHDADGGPLTAKVEYSFDNGHTYTTLWSGPATGRVKVPSTLVSGSRRARIRVRVSDGFNEGRAVSGRFTAVGSPPQVTITSPPRGLRVATDSVVSVAGQAYDDRHNRVSPHRLVWFEGSRRVGRGSQLMLRGFAAGRLHLRLVVRDPRGRTGTAEVTIRVRPAVPQILSLVTPRELTSSARTVRLRIAATEPCRLAVSGKHVRLTTKPRTVKVRVRPGTSALILKLSAGRLHSSTKVLLTRG
jgi:hypothetical protein